MAEEELVPAARQIGSEAVSTDVIVKHLMRKYGWLPDKQEHVTQFVLAQAELVCEEWAV